MQNNIKSPLDPVYLYSADSACVASASAMITFYLPNVSSALRRWQRSIILFMLAAALLAGNLLTQGNDVMTVAPFHGKGTTIETKDGKLYYETEGSGPVVILVAGGPGGGHSSFHGFFGDLAKDHTVVYFDNIGRGRSDRLKDPKKYTVWRDAEDIEAIRKALGADKVSVIGHSYGGMPAIAYGIRYANRVHKLVLSDTLHGGKAFQENIDSCNFHARNQFPAQWEKLMALRAKGVKSSADAYADIYGECLNEVYWFDESNGSKMFRSSDPKDGFNGEVYAAMLGDDPEWKVQGTMRSFEPRGDMKKITAPTMICVGRYDRVATPKVAHDMSKMIPGSKLVIFDKSGHRPWVEERALYFRMVGDFLK